MVHPAINNSDNVAAIHSRKVVNATGKNQKSTASECIMAQYKKERNVWLFTSLIIIQEEIMKYTIESMNDGCIEIIELSDGSKYKKKHIKTECGSTQEDLDFCKQMERDGICEEILDEVYDTFDGFLVSSFLRISEFDC